MSQSKSPSASRTDATRRRVLDAAERLLRNGSPEFSMRDLAAEAGVSFATPFNQFGSKVAIMQALSSARIATMAERFAGAPPEGDAVDRVLVAVAIAAAVMLDEPQVNRAVIGTIGAPSEAPGPAYTLSRDLWAQAVGAGDGFAPEVRDIVRRHLPDQLAIAFRGVLSFWTAGEILDADLASSAQTAAITMMLGFLAPERRHQVSARLADGFRRTRSAPERSAVRLPEG